MFKKHKLLSGPYVVCFQPEKMCRYGERKEMVHTLKRPQTERDLYESNWMIDTSLDWFDAAIEHNGYRKYGIGNFGYFDIRFSLPSKSNTTRRITDVMNKKLVRPTYHNVFYKKNGSEVFLDEQAILSEPSGEKNLAKIKARFEYVKRLYWDTPFEVKMVDVKWRRFVRNFIGIIPDWLPALESIRGKNILLCDDTLGEGITMMETTRLLLPFGPKSITAFAVVRDFWRT